MAKNVSLFLLFCFFLSIFVLSFVVVMGFVLDVGGVVMGFVASHGCCCGGFVASHGCGCDGFYGVFLFFFFQWQ